MKKRGTVLVVDDVPQNLAVVFEVLSQGGYEVLVVENGETALERMDIMKPDLILLDVRLPGADGYKICQRLKKKPDTSDIPIIMMTALNNTEDMLEGFSSGAVDYVCKPVAAEEVLVRVDTHMQLKQLRERLLERNQELLKEVRKRREAERQLEQSLDRAVMLIGEQGEVSFATKRAWDLITRFFTEAPPSGLPEPLHNWITSAETDAHSFECSNGSLTAKRFSNTSGKSCVVSLEENLNVPSTSELQKLGLTPKEAEVLYWMAQGKTSPEIATILESAPNTIKKHAQRIYQKLEVDNRTAAALRAAEVSSQG